jgi:glucans biosynthesis protein C
MNVAISPIRHPQACATRGERSIGPDLIRAIAAVMVVYLHACVPYLKHPMPGLIWPVMDQSSGICDVLFWAIEVVVMPLFLVISGFYAYRALIGTDWQSLLKSRVRRLLRPLVFGMIVILPIDLYIWVTGLIAEGHMPLSKLKSLKVPSPMGEQLWGLSHLWFLMYVFLYVVVMVAVAHLLRNGIALRFRPTVRRASGLAIAMAGIITLALSPEVVFGFQHAFVPVFSKWVYSGTFFAGGIAIANFDPNFRMIDRLAGRHLAIGTMATLATVLLGRWTLRMVPGSDELAIHQLATHSWLISTSLASITVLAAWCVTFGSIGLANRSSERLTRFPRLCQGIRYFAGASFWIYLVHHPIVGLAHIDLKWLAPGLWPAVKSLLTLGIAVGWGLLSYEFMIRKTAFGEALGLTDSSAAATKKAPADRSESEPLAQVRRAA